MLKGLGFESYVSKLFVILIVYYFDNMIDHDE